MSEAARSKLAKPNQLDLDRQQEAGVAISAAVHLQCGTKRSNDKHGYTKGSHVPGKYILTNPPKIAPTAVPMKRCAETGRAAPRSDCITIWVEIATQ